jgi:hypothetical protein
VTTSSTTSTRRGDPPAALDQVPGSATGDATAAVPGVDQGLTPRYAPPGLPDGVRLLEQAVQMLDAAAEAGDADLARTCRGVLDSLRAHGAMTSACGAPGVTGEEPSRSSRVPLAPHGWARGSILEDGGIVHETVSPLHPTIKVGGVNGSQAVPTDVSLSVTDLLIDGRWVRTRPTVQVEGGSYDLDGARQLRDALGRLLAAVDASATDTATR